MKFDNDKIESVELLQDDEWTQTCAIHYNFSNVYGARMLGTERADSAMLIYNKHAYGCGESPYYRVLAIEDMEMINELLDDGKPIRSTVKKWYEDVPMAVPMAWIADNLV